MDDLDALQAQVGGIIQARVERSRELLLEAQRSIESLLGSGLVVNGLRDALRQYEQRLEEADKVAQQCQAKAHGAFRADAPK